MELLSLPAPAHLVRVVGTNGKGSVSAMLAAGLSAQGHTTGRFLSPHVEEFSERVAVDGVAVTAEQVIEFVATAREMLALKPPPSDLRPAFFELTLALALTVFAESRVSHAVLEAGVGGASDATSAAVRAGADTNLRLVVLTNVDLDHTETLGPTIAAIAAEKAGAFASGVTAITGAVGEALSVIRRVADERGAWLIVDDGTDPLFELPSGADGAEGPREPSSTRQANARLAAAGLRLLGASERSVKTALAAAPLPARGERFVVRGREIVLDGAHDPAAALRLLAEVGHGYVLLFGSLARKQGAATLERLAAGATTIVVTAAESGDELERFAAPGRELLAEPAAALRLALELTPPGGRLVVAGSLYLAGTLRPLLREMAGRSPA